MTAISQLHRPAARAIIAVTVIALTAAVSGCSTEPPRDDLCGGMTIDDSASITSSTDILIDAPIDVVWDVHTDVEAWDEWQDAVTTIERLDDGQLASDSQFRWTTPVPESAIAPADTLTITSTVQQLEDERCVIWQGPAVGESITIDQGTHLWSLTETGEGTMVHTEESWDAALLDALPDADVAPVAELLGTSLDVWLQALQARAEAVA